MTQYNNPIPVVVGLITVMDTSRSDLVRFKVLVGTRAIQPFVGQRALIGGFVNEGENFETALSREIQEETGKYLEPDLWKYVTSKITPRNQVLVFYHMGVENEAVMGELLDTSEMTDLEWVTYQDIDEIPLCFPLHQNVAKNLLEDLAISIRS